MTNEYDRIADKRNISTAEQRWDSPIDISPGSNVYALLSALLTETDRVDEDLEKIYEQHHIDSATGESLEKFGSLVNVDRKSGESDNKYRARIKATFRASTTGTTFNQFIEFCASVLGTDVENLNFSTPYNSEPASVTVGAQQSVYDGADLSNQEVKELLGEGVPAGHKVNVVVGGTFRVKNDGDTDDPDKGLTSDSITTGGTLAEDLA